MIRRLYALRWWMISLITIGTILNYMTRTMLGVAAPTIVQDSQGGSWQPVAAPMRPPTSFAVASTSP